MSLSSWFWLGQKLQIIIWCNQSLRFFPFYTGFMQNGTGGNQTCRQKWNDRFIESQRGLGWKGTFKGHSVQPLQWQKYLQLDQVAQSHIIHDLECFQWNTHNERDFHLFFTLHTSIKVCQNDCLLWNVQSLGKLIVGRIINAVRNFIVKIAC